MHIEDKQNSTIDISQLRKWLTCLALVTFDIDEGQQIEHIVPHHKLNDRTSKQLAMLAFPDSNSFSDYENSFKFTFRMSNNLFGYACFKQKKDPNNPRGFSQKSMVILSQLPLVEVFQKICEFFVFKTFNKIESDELLKMMENLCEQVCKWPTPNPRAELTLPILQYELTVKIPNFVHNWHLHSKKSLNNHLENELKDKQLNLKNILDEQQLLRSGPFQQIKLNQIFSHSYEALWAVWQNVMLNRAALILGQNPHQVSHAVLGAVSLAYPFQYWGNYNPYVTVYDPNLDKLTMANKNIIAGGTNPLFQKLFNKEVTNIIKLDKNCKCSKRLRPLSNLLLRTSSEEQQSINQAAIRKYFYQINKSILLLLDSFLFQQINNLKFFNDASFLKYLKDRKDYFGFEDVFSSKKYVIEFFQQFINTVNFQHYLSIKNVIRSKNQ